MEGEVGEVKIDKLGRLDGESGHKYVKEFRNKLNG